MFLPQQKSPVPWLNPLKNPSEIYRRSLAS